MNRESKGEWPEAVSNYASGPGFDVCFLGLPGARVVVLSCGRVATVLSFMWISVDSSLMRASTCESKIGRPIFGSRCRELLVDRSTVTRSEFWCLVFVGVALRRWIGGH